MPSTDEGGRTLYGFTWGPVSVERAAILDRGRGPHRVLSITSEYSSQNLEIYISPGGRSIRVFRGGVELKS